MSSHPSPCKACAILCAKPACATTETHDVDAWLTLLVCLRWEGAQQRTVDSRDLEPKWHARQASETSELYQGTSRHLSTPDTLAWYSKKKCFTRGHPGISRRRTPSPGTRLWGKNLEHQALLALTFSTVSEASTSLILDHLLRIGEMILA